MDLYNFVSLLGIVILVALGYLLSNNRKKVNWHVIVWAIGLQMLFAWFLFVIPAGVKFFEIVNSIVVSVLDSSMAGTKFLFGPLALAPGMSDDSGSESIGFILAFQAFPAIIFFSSLMAILYYFNIIPKIIKAFASLFTKLMKISGAESLCAASNIFVGVESALTVKPFLKDMTKSELCTVLCAGMATVSSNVLAIYVFSLQLTFPNIAGHLISASFLSAPAALAMSKLLIPESETPKTLGENIELHYEKEDSMFEAIINGANAGVKLIVGICALLIAILGLVALIDMVIGYCGGQVNQWLNFTFEWSLTNVLSYIFYPFSLIMGVPQADALEVSRLIAQRSILTEVVAYQNLSGLIQSQTFEFKRSIVIATYALCGFAHIASMAIFVGGLSAIIPERTKDIAQCGFRALIAATLACLLTACVAGVFFTKSSALIIGS